MDKELEKPLMNTNTSESEEECSENKRETKEEKQSDCVLNHPEGRLRKQIFHLPGGKGQFMSASDNIYRDEENENCQEGLSDPLSSAASDLLGILSSDKESRAEIPSCNYNEIETVTHTKQESAESKDDLTPLPVYLINYKLTNDDKYAFSVENNYANTEIKLEGVTYKSEATTADALYGSKNIKREHNEVETVSQSCNEIQISSQQPPIRGKVKSRKRNLCSNSCEINSPKEDPRVKYKSRRKRNTVIELEKSFSLKIQMKSESNARNYERQLCKRKLLSQCTLTKDIIHHTPDARFKCEICEYKCTVRSTLKLHMRTHTGEKPFACEICGYKCTLNSHLTMHMRTHTGEKPFKCEICGYKCTVSSSLKLHKRTHTGEKPYQCEICGYKFARRSSLTMHIGTHTGEKPYQCEICGYKCARGSSLKFHMRTHTGEKPYKCETCGYKSTRGNDLKLHMRTHTGEKPYNCEICGYKCTVSSSLKSHMRTHTGERFYQCDTCGYNCTQGSTLNKHMKTHTGEKPYNCEICEYKCSRGSNFKTHMRFHSGKTA